MLVASSSSFRVTASAPDLSGSSFGTAPEFVRGIFDTIARRGHEVRAELVWWEALWCASIGGRRHRSGRSGYGAAVELGRLEAKGRGTALIDAQMYGYSKDPAGNTSRQ
jgi:hypothetical protein